MNNLEEIGIVNLISVYMDTKENDKAIERLLKYKKSILQECARRTIVWYTYNSDMNDPEVLRGIIMDDKNGL